MKRQWRGIDTDPGWINRRFHDLETQVKQLRSEKRLDASSVSGGVVTVHEILTNPARVVEFVNTDTATATGPGDDIDILLSHAPKPGSEQVFYNGTPLKRSDWSRTDTVLTIPGETWFRAGKVAWVDYAYDGTQTRIGPVITSPSDGSATADDTPTITGTAAALRSVEVRVDGSSVGSTTADASGTWSVTVASPLASGAHEVTALQIEPDGTSLAATPVTFSVISVPPSVVGVTTITGAQTSIALPAGTSDGDVLVLVLGGSCTVTDPRMDGGYQPNPAGFTPGGIWVGHATASSAPLAITTADPGCAGALIAVSAVPSAITQDAQSTGTSMPFIPTVPGPASFGIAAIFAGSGLVAGALQNEDTGVWTTRATVWGGGSGKMSVYIGTATGIPAGGTWHTVGSDAFWGARIVGVQ